MMQALLSRGADASLVDNQGQTVFGWAEPSPSTAKYVTAFLTDRGISRQPPRPAAPPPSPQVKASLSTLAAVAGARSSGVAFGPHGAAARERRAVAASERCPRNGPPSRPTTTATTFRATSRRSRRRSKPARPRAWPRRCESVAEDLEIKLEHCNLSGGKLGGSVDRARENRGRRSRRAGAGRCSTCRGSSRRPPTPARICFRS